MHKQRVPDGRSKIEFEMQTPDGEKTKIVKSGVFEGDVFTSDDGEMTIEYTPDGLPVVKWANMEMRSQTRDELGNIPVVDASKNTFVIWVREAALLGELRKWLAGHGWTIKVSTTFRDLRSNAVTVGLRGDIAAAPPEDIEALVRKLMELEDHVDLRIGIGSDVTGIFQTKRVWEPIVPL